MNDIDKSSQEFYSKVVSLLQLAKRNVVSSVNHQMVITYFEIGRMIVEEEQNGKERAEYGKELLKGLSKTLTEKFGRGYSVQNIERMRMFYLVYGKSSTALRISIIISYLKIILNLIYHGHII